MSALLTKKQRDLPPGARVQTLRRIARRATLKADWLSTFLTNPAPHYQDPEEQARLRADITALREKAERAAEAMCVVVLENPDGHWTLPQRRAAQQFLDGVK